MVQPQYAQQLVERVFERRLDEEHEDFIDMLYSEVDETDVEALITSVEVGLESV